MFPDARSSPTDHVKRPRANPGAQNVQARIVIPVDYQAAGRTRMRAHGERLGHEFMAARAFLTGISRIDSNEMATSLFNFVAEHRDEPRP